MIKTDRLDLIACEVKHFEAFERNENELAEMLDIKFADGWLVFPEIICKN